MISTITIWMAQIYCYYEWTRLLILVVFSIYSASYLYQPKNSYYSFALICSKCYSPFSAKVINSSLLNTNVPAIKKVVDTKVNECPVCGNAHFYPYSRIRIYFSYFLHLWRFFVNHPVFANFLLLLFIEIYALTYWYFLFCVLQVIFNKSVRKWFIDAFYALKSFSISQPQDFTKHISGISISDIITFLTEYRDDTLTINKATLFFRNRGYEASEHQMRKVMTKLEVDKIITKDPNNQNARILRVSPLQAEQLLKTRMDMKDGSSFHIYRGTPPPLPVERVEFTMKRLT